MVGGVSGNDRHPAGEMDIVVVDRWQSTENRWRGERQALNDLNHRGDSSFGRLRFGRRGPDLLTDALGIGGVQGIIEAVHCRLIHIC
jgi:hypothetical protein